MSEVPSAAGGGTGSEARVRACHAAEGGDLGDRDTPLDPAVNTNSNHAKRA